MNAATARLRALAEGPALDLPPVRWEAPAEMGAGSYPFARWGALPWEAEPDVARWPLVYLYAYDIAGTDAPSLDVAGEGCTVAEAKTLLDRLTSAIAMAEELTR